MPMTDHMRGLIEATIATGRLALYTESPSASSPGVEVTGGSYARVTVAIASDPANPNILRTTDNAEYTNMPECDVVAVGLLDSTGHNLLYYAPVTPAKTFGEGDSGIILANSFAIELN